MGDPDAAAGPPPTGPPVTAVLVEVPDSRLPLARARNAGAATAIESGADLLVFLDVDCIPAPGLVRRYVGARRGRGSATALRAGRLSPPAAAGRLRPRSAAANWPTRTRRARARPRTRPCATGTAAVLVVVVRRRPDVWDRIGGFCEEYAATAARTPTSASSPQPPASGSTGSAARTPTTSSTRRATRRSEHVDDILANAHVFFRRWGWWPMTGWLTGFERLGLVTHNAAADTDSGLGISPMGE